MTDKKTCRFPLLLSPAERAALQAQADAVGVNPSAYIRMLLRAEKPTAAGDQKLAREALADMGRMGGNLNQIAKQLNEGQVLQPERVNPVLRGTQNAVLEATEQLLSLLEGQRP